jgi:CheY-like chemotaxis protein
MTTSPLNLLLADDDIDDCFFFQEALEEFPIPTRLTTVHDGVQLMQLLAAIHESLPDALFLDLNMPRKSGFDCLAEIKTIDALMHLPVIIYSTSLNGEVIDLLYEKGVQYYICKPGDYDKLKKVIFEAVTLVAQNKSSQPARDRFVLYP